jgi:hypothetical protein
MSKILKHFNYIIIFLFFFILNSCKNSASLSPIAYEMANPPIITGIIRTTPEGPFPIGTWGKPIEKGSLPFDGQPAPGIPSEYMMDALYPNPTDGAVIIRYILPVRTNISCWVVRGKTSGNATRNGAAYLNGYFVVPNINFSLKLFEETSEAGAYQFTWSCKDKDNNLLPNGLYRIYLSVDGKLMWRDLMIYNGIGGEEGAIPNIFN